MPLHIIQQHWELELVTESQRRGTDEPNPPRPIFCLCHLTLSPASFLNFGWKNHIRGFALVLEKNGPSLSLWLLGNCLLCISRYW